MNCALFDLIDVQIAPRRRISLQYRTFHAALVIPECSGGMSRENFPGNHQRIKEFPMGTKFKLAAWRIGAGLVALLAMFVATPVKAELISPVIRDSLTFMPPHVAGDNEFSGNGPSVYVKVKFSIRDNALVYSLYFKARETKSDWTEASGWSSARTAYTAPAGMRIDSLPKSEYELLITTMSGHSEKAFVTPLGRVTVWGDTKGKDAGVYTKIKFDMDTTIPMNVSMSAPNPEQTIPLPRTMTFTPPHTRGDKDFSGNGPRVVVDAWVEHDGQAVYFVVKMIAEETKPDSTTAAGTTRSLMYAAPIGRRITGIGGTTSWPGLVSYYDSNHEVDKFNTPLGPVSVFGDHRGDDAGTYTKVVLANINQSIVVKTAANP
jgi:hypothetical protein